MRHLHWGSCFGNVTFAKVTRGGLTPQTGSGDVVHEDKEPKLIVVPLIQFSHSCRELVTQYIQFTPSLPYPKGVQVIKGLKTWARAFGVKPELFVRIRTEQRRVLPASILIPFRLPEGSKTVAFGA